MEAHALGRAFAGQQAQSAVKGGQGRLHIPGLIAPQPLEEMGGPQRVLAVVKALEGAVAEVPGAVGITRPARGSGRPGQELDPVKRRRPGIGRFELPQFDRPAEMGQRLAVAKDTLGARPSLDRGQEGQPRLVGQLPVPGALARVLDRGDAVKRPGDPTVQGGPLHREQIAVHRFGEEAVAHVIAAGPALAHEHVVIDALAQRGLERRPG